jgi:GDP-4-dehydro-6-deoxy-D-mannose reductase
MVPDMAPHVLITGASGFAGRHMAEYLHGLGCAIYGVSRHAHGSPHASTILGDLTMPDSAAQAVRESRPDYVVHLAARTPANSPAGADREWLLDTPLSTLNLLEAVRLQRPKARVLIVSSSAVYGHIPPEQMPIDEEAPMRPTTMYGVSKATQELLATRYAAEYGLCVIRARPFNLVGPGEPQRMLTSALASQVAEIAAGRAAPIVRMRHRATARDFTDIRDAVRAYWALLCNGEPGEVYNVCSGIATPIGTVVDSLLAAASITARVEETAAEPSPNDIAIQQGSNQRIGQAIGWRPEIDLTTSLADVLRSFDTSGTPTIP